MAVNPDNGLPAYARLIRPAYNDQNCVWSYCGFPANKAGVVLTRRYVVCTECNLPLPHNDAHGSAPLLAHFQTVHPDIHRLVMQTNGTPAATSRRRHPDGRRTSGTNGRAMAASQSSQSDPDLDPVVDVGQPVEAVYELKPDTGVDGADADCPTAHDDEHIADSSGGGGDGCEVVGESDIIEYLLADDEHEELVLEPVATIPAKNEPTSPASANGPKRRAAGCDDDDADNNDDGGVHSDHTWPVRKKPKPEPVHQIKANTHAPLDPPDLKRLLAEMCADDLLRPSLVDGPAFARLLRHLSGVHCVPTGAEVRTEIRRMHADMRRATHRPTIRPFALTVDRWTTIESVAFYTLGIVTANDGDDGDDEETSSAGPAGCARTGRRSLCTWREGAEPAHQWTDALRAVDMAQCQAIVVNFELDDAPMPAIVADGSLPVVRCMVDVIAMAANSALDLVDNVGIADAAECDDWLDRLAKLEQLVELQRDADAWRNCPAGRIVRCLQPLRIALETLRLEVDATASLCRPLAEQLVQNHFSETGDNDAVNEPDGDGFDLVLANMKAAVREQFETHILSNEFLPAVSYLDPRFHALADDDQLPAIGAAIRAMCPIVMAAADPVPAGPVAADANAARPADDEKPAKAGLSFFFAASKAAPASGRSRPRAPPPPPLDVELKQYAAVDSLPLDRSPRDWWAGQATVLPLLAAAARRLWCVPAVLRTSDDVARARCWLRADDDDDDVDALLGVHEHRASRGSPADRGCD